MGNQGSYMTSCTLALPSFNRLLHFLSCSEITGNLNTIYFFFETCFYDTFSQTSHNTPSHLLLPATTHVHTDYAIIFSSQFIDIFWTWILQHAKAVLYKATIFSIKTINSVQCYLRQGHFTTFKELSHVMKFNQLFPPIILICYSVQLLDWTVCWPICIEILFSNTKYHSKFWWRAKFHEVWTLLYQWLLLHLCLYILFWKRHKITFTM